MTAPHHLVSGSKSLKEPKVLLPLPTRLKLQGKHFEPMMQCLAKAGYKSRKCLLASQEIANQTLIQQWVSPAVQVSSQSVVLFWSQHLFMLLLSLACSKRLSRVERHGTAENNISSNRYFVNLDQLNRWLHWLTGSKSFLEVYLRRLMLISNDLPFLQEGKCRTRPAAQEDQGPKTKAHNWVPPGLSPCRPYRHPLGQSSQPILIIAFCSRSTDSSTKVMLFGAILAERLAEAHKVPQLTW